MVNVDNKFNVRMTKEQLVIKSINKSSIGVRSSPSKGKNGKKPVDMCSGDGGKVLIHEERYFQQSVSKRIMPLEEMGEKHLKY